MAINQKGLKQHKEVWSGKHRDWLIEEELDKQLMDDPKFAKAHFDLHDGEDYGREPDVHNELVRNYETVKSKLVKERNISLDQVSQNTDKKVKDIANQLKSQGVTTPINYYSLRGNGEWNFDEVSPGKYAPAGKFAQESKEINIKKPHISAQQFPMFEQLSLFD